MTNRVYAVILFPEVHRGFCFGEDYSYLGERDEIDLSDFYLTDIVQIQKDWPGWWQIPSEAHALHTNLYDFVVVWRKRLNERRQNRASRRRKNY